MAKSKSVQKRIVAQKGKTTSNSEDVLVELTSRIEKLEARQSLVAESFQFVADETRGLFGLAPIALVFDAIAKKLR